MLEWIREKFGRVVISIIIGFIACVFVFYGVFSPRATRGLHAGAVAGMVNGDAISISEFNRSLSQRLEFFKSMGGGKITDEQMKQFHVREGVFNELVSRKLMSQEAHRMGLLPSDEEVREKIMEMDVFKKEGQFDVVKYRQLLEANRYSPGSFENLMRNDISLQNFEEFLKNRVRVSETEMKREFLLTNDKRDIKYVLFTLESGRKALAGLESEKDPKTASKTTPKMPPKITPKISPKITDDEIRKNNEKLADQALALLKLDDKTKEKSKKDSKTDKKETKNKADLALNQLLKPYGLEVKATGLVTNSSRYLSGVGEVPVLFADAFDQKNGLDPRLGGKAKKYVIPAGILVALVNQSEKPDLTKLGSEKEELIKKLTSRKAQELNLSVIKQLNTKAKIERNPQIVDGKEDPSGQAPYDDG